MAKASKLLAKINMNGRDIEVMDSIGSMDLDDMRSEIENAGAMQVWAGVLSANARHDANLAKLHAEIKKAELGKEKRQINDQMGRKSTERSVEEEVILDPSYKESQEHMLEMARRADIMESAKYAAVQKANTIGRLSEMAAEQIRLGPKVILQDLQPRGLTTDDVKKKTSTPARKRRK